MEQREADGGEDAVVTFLSSVLERPLPKPGETFVISTFSATESTELDRYQFDIPLNDDFLLDYVSDLAPGRPFWYQPTIR